MYRVTRHSDSKEFAAKMMKIRDHRLKMVMNEISVMNKLCHENLVKLVAAYSEDRNRFKEITLVQE